MVMENNRTWVEEGSYSVPTDEKKPLIPLKVKGIIFLLFYVVLSEACLNYYISGHFLRTPRTFTMSPLWGWRSLISMYHAYGIKEMALLKITFALVCTFMIAAVLFRVLFFDRVERDKNKLAILHGSSHWATKEEIIESGLMLPDNAEPSPKVGVTVGGWKDKKGKIHYLRHSGPEHILVVAPTRSGKGISIVVPTLLSWNSSVVVLDIKGENWALSAGWRRSLGECIRFEPTDKKSPARYNPLNEIAIGTPYETKDAMNVAEMIIDPEGTGEGSGNEHWTNSAKGLCTAAILYECYTAREEKREPSLINVRNSISTGDINQNMTEWQDKVFKYKDEDGVEHEDSSPTIIAVAKQMIQTNEKERASMFSTAIVRLTLWLDPVIARNTSESTFSIKDLVDDKKPKSLYIIIPPSDLDRLRPILKLLLSQILLVLCDRMVVDEVHGGVKSTHNHQLLLMLDEASRLAKFNTLEGGLSYCSSYGVKVCAIYQSYKQPKSLFGQNETLTGGFKLHVAFAPNEDEDARILSEKCGKTTVIVGSSNISGKRFAVGPFGKSSESVSYTQQSRDLLMPDEVKRLRGPKKDADGRVIEPGALLLLAAGIPPIYGIQTPFFFDPIINKRSKIPAEGNVKIISADGKNTSANAAQETEHAQPETSQAHEQQNRLLPETGEETVPDVNHEEDSPSQMPVEAAESYETIEDTNEANIVSEKAVSEGQNQEETSPVAQTTAGTDENDQSDESEDVIYDDYLSEDEGEDLLDNLPKDESDEKTDKDMGTVENANLDEESKEKLGVEQNTDDSETDIDEEEDSAETAQDIRGMLDLLQPIEAPGTDAA